MRGVTQGLPALISVCTFQPALPMRGVTRIAIDHHVGIPISTRTPHAGSDFDDFITMALNRQFQPALPMRGVTGKDENHDHVRAISTRTPHAGSDARRNETIVEEFQFQPALPMRGVTTRPQRWDWPRLHFNPHSPCGE